MDGGDEASVVFLYVYFVFFLFEVFAIFTLRVRLRLP